MPPATLLERPISRSSAPSPLMALEDTLRDLLASGGPMPADYAHMNRSLRQLGDSVRAEIITRREVLSYVKDITTRHLDNTLQSRALAKKYGYSGDFEIIDDIYTQRIIASEELRRWDLYFHAQPAPVAVRNRKAYFHHLLNKHHGSKSGPLHILNVASGPARDMREWMLDHPNADLFFDCIDADVHAIDHARVLCAPFIDRVEFHHRNAMRFLPSKGFQLVWSAGLFDYLSDRAFVFLLKSLLAVTSRGGEVVIGNFSDFNPSRDYMELMGDWMLNHRTAKQLRELAIEAGAPAKRIDIQWEPEGVNLFMHIQC